MKLRPSIVVPCVLSVAVSVNALANNDLSTTYRSGSIAAPDIDESTNTGVVTINQGRAAYALDVVAPPGREGVEPTLAIAYHGSRQEGVVGSGWALTYPSVRVRTNGRGGQPNFGVAVRYVGLGGEELVQTPGTLADVDGDGVPEHVYFEERNTSYLRYVELSGGGWRIDFPTGTKLELGTDANNRIVRSTALSTSYESHIAEWLPERMSDVDGNELVWTWSTPSTVGTDVGATALNTVQRYLTEIRYGCTTCETASSYQSIEVHYAVLSSHIMDFSPGFLVETEFFVTSISTHSTVQGTTSDVRTYELTYDTDDTRRLLVEVATTSPNEAESAPISFTYTERDGPSSLPLTIDGEPTVAFESGVEPIDIDYDGRVDVVDLTSAGSAAGSYFRNVGSSVADFGSSQTISALPGSSIGSSNTDASAEDATRDVAVDVFDLASGTIYAHNREDGWDGTGTSATLPVIALSNDVIRIDMNGDGYVDMVDTSAAQWWVYLDDGSHTYTDDSFQLTAQTTPTFGTTTLSASLDGVLFGDVNGDGLTDVVYLETGGTDDFAHVYFGRGRLGFGLLEDEDRSSTHWNAMYVTYVVTSSSDSPVPAESRLADIDGDGLADLLSFDTAADRLRVWQRVPGSGFTDDDTQSPFTQGIDPLDGCRVADWDADAVNEVLCSDDWQLFDWADQRPMLLAEIDNGLGLTTRLTYSTTARYAAAHEAASDPWDVNVSMAMPVVAAQERDDARGNVLVVEYDYRDAFMETNAVEDRFGFGGFGYVASEEIAYLETTPGDPSTRIEDPQDPGVLNRTWYDVGDTEHFARGMKKCAELWSRSASPTSFECDTAATGPLVRTVWAYTVEDPEDDGVYVTHVDAEDRYVLEGSAVSAGARIRTEYAYDALGNQTVLRELGTYSGTLDDTGEDQRMTVRSFILNVDDWIVRLPRWVQIGDVDLTTADIVPAEQTCVVYDGVANLCPPASYDATRDDPLVTGGKATQSWVYDDDDPTDATPGSWIAVGSTSYTSHGLVDVATDAEGTTIDTDYDADFGFFRVSTTVDPNGLAFVTAYESDPRHGRVIEETLPDGTRIEAEYDDFGRLEKLWRNADIGSTPTLVRRYTLSDPLSSINDLVVIDGTGFETTYRIDGAGRKICTAQESEPLGIPNIPGILPDPRDVTQREYTSRGLTAIEYRAFAGHGCYPNTADTNGRAPYGPHDAMVYDARGRVLERRHQPDDEYVTTSYGVLSLSVLDEKDNDATALYDTPTTSVYDGLGRLVRIVETIDTDGDQVVESIETSYVYDARDNLVSVEDDQGTEIHSALVDARGRVVSSNDATRGARTMTYDGRDRLLVETDARGFTVTNTYDAAGRTTSVVSDDGAGGFPVEKVTYFYDDHPVPSQTAPCHTTGRLAEVSDTSGRTVFCYDDEGRATRIETILTDYSASTAFITVREFDDDGRMSLMTYPDGTKVAYTYTISGEPDTATVESPSGATVQLIADAKYDPSGRLVELSYGNGATMTIDFDDRGRTTAIDTTITGTTGVSLALDYDPVGNLAAVTDAVGNRSAMYAYDDLNRLVSASGAGVAGQTLTYAYDLLGNMVARSSSDTSSPLHIAEMVYATAGGSDPWNALLDVDRDGDGKFDEQLSYDAVGNLAEDGAHRFTFDPSSYLREVEDLSGVVMAEYTYDHEHRRVVTSYPGSGDQVFFVRPGETEIRRIGGTETNRKFIKFGKHVVGVVDGTFTATTTQDHVFLMGFDHLGTPALVMSVGSSPTVIERYASFPFGAENPDATIGGYRTPSDTDSKLTRRFQGREIDTELPDFYDFAARTYRSDFARFLSADSVIPNINSSQGWNRYAFVTNNPNRFHDPTGHNGLQIIGMWIYYSAACDLCAGYFDEVTFGLTEIGREYAGLTDRVDVTSDAYSGGGWVGFGVSAIYAGPKAAVEEGIEVFIFYEQDAYAAKKGGGAGGGRVTPARVFVGTMQQLYDYLRPKTPSKAAKAHVWEGITLPFHDRSIDILTWEVDIDHVVALQRMIHLPGFRRLNVDNMLTVVNDIRNLVAMSMTSNRAMGAKSYIDYVYHKTRGLPVDEAWQAEMIELEAKLMKIIQERIDELLKEQGDL
ncbi:MAG: toxin TcdB middle/N-terminal domain-containing protein [Deltaproteobacteria bacterium]